MNFEKDRPAPTFCASGRHTAPAHVGSSRRYGGRCAGTASREIAESICGAAGNRIVASRAPWYRRGSVDHPTSDACRENRMC
jgi:hypothetical protein